MNTGEGRAKSKARFNELKQRGSLEEQEFNVVKKDLAMAGTRMAAQSIKGN